MSYASIDINSENQNKQIDKNGIRIGSIPQIRREYHKAGKRRKTDSRKKKYEWNPGKNGRKTNL